MAGNGGLAITDAEIKLSIQYVYKTDKGCSIVSSKDNFDNFSGINPVRVLNRDRVDLVISNFVIRLYRFSNKIWLLYNGCEFIS